MKIVFDDGDKADIRAEYLRCFNRPATAGEVDTLLGLIELALTQNCFAEELDYFLENNVDDDGNFMLTTKEDR